jgi:hypothetical protein
MDTGRLWLNCLVLCVLLVPGGWLANTDVDNVGNRGKKSHLRATRPLFLGDKQTSASDTRA